MKIAHFGTFDVENYGDLLFPLLIERRLGNENNEFVHVSPAGGAPAIDDCKLAIGFEQALAECESWDAIVLGGGALAHGDFAGEVDKYQAPDIHTIAYPGLWLLPALISSLRGLPLAWNSPGVPGDFSSERKHRLLQWAAWQADYLSVRDMASAEVLAQSLVESRVVPDTAVEVSRLWSEDELRRESERLRSHEGWPRNAYLALHLNERYAGSDLAALGREIGQICLKQGASALLIGIGDCHGDTAFAHRVLPYVRDCPVHILRPDSLRSVAAAIRFAQGYIGSSLHGAITAYSLARPLLIVAPKSRSKFAGFLAQIEALESQVPDWSAVDGAMEKAFAIPEQSEILSDRRAVLDQTFEEHWAHLSRALATPRSVSPQAAPRILEMLSEMPPEWFPLVPLLEKSSLFAPLFTKYTGVWAAARRHLQESAFVAAASYRRLDIRHEKLLSDVNALQAKLTEANAKLGASREEAKKIQRDQRRVFDEKLDALLATIHKRDGRVELLEEQKKALDEKLRHQVASVRQREAQLRQREGQLRERDEQLRERDERISALTKKSNTQIGEIRERDVRLGKLREAGQKLEEMLRKAQKDLAKLQKWSDRLLQDFEKILHSNRWRIGCWLSLKRTGDQSKEGQRLAQLLASRPRPVRDQGDAAAPPQLSVKANSEVRSATAVAQASPTAASSPPRIESPAPVTPEIEVRSAPAPRPPAAGTGQFISIVIPVHNAYEDLVRCLESVQRYSRSDLPVITIDDASSDERIWPLLRDWASRHPNFRAVRNETNLGYTRTVNLGCELAGAGDVILVNSDTVVPPHWVEQLAACAYSRPGVATVTALSNAAGAFSVPEKNAVNALPPGWGVDEMATFVERTSQRLRPVVPTGNGFCLYLTSIARAAVGRFDADNFPSGYGEENDFCLRASAAGLVNLIDDATYVFHRRSASFGAAKDEILKTSRKVLDRLHPTYTQRIREWSENDSLDPVRTQLQEKLVEAGEHGWKSFLPDEERQCLLFVLHDGTGGTRFTSEDLSNAMAQSYRTIVLLAALDRWTLWEYFEAEMVPVRSYAFAEPWRVDRPLTPDRLLALREICQDYGVEIAHVRHLLGSGPELLDVLQELAIPIVFSFHDFYTVCPTIQLLDENRNYCAGRCTSGAGDCRMPANWYRPPLPWLKHRYVHLHQRRMGAAIERCDAFVTTSESSRDLILQHFPTLQDERFTIIEHGRDLARLELAQAPVSGQPLRAIFFGALSPAKGMKLITELLEKNREAGSPIEIHVLGQVPLNFDPAKLGATYHGAYDREELPERVRAIGAAVSLVPSLWPETYCHVLTESWAMGLPVLASDIGTLRERVLKNGGGWLLPVGDSERWLEKMLDLIDDSMSYAAALEEIRKMQFPDIAWMARQYEDIYQQLLEKRRFVRGEFGATA